MANSFAGNVYKVDTDGTTLAQCTNICGIKFVPAADGTCTIKKGTTSGSLLWQHAAGDGDPTAIEPIFDAVEIRSPTGVFVNVSSGSVVYIYTKA